MDKPFQYDKYATGKDFIGRRRESITIESMLRSNQNVLLYDAPKTGKGSLIRHALYDLKISSYPFIAGHISLACIRSRDTFLREYASTLLKSAAAGRAGGTPALPLVRIHLLGLAHRERHIARDELSIACPGLCQGLPFLQKSFCNLSNISQ